MVKMIVLGLLTVVATLAGAYAGLRVSPGATSGASAKEQEAVELVKLDPASVPVIRNGAIAGYVVVHAAYTATAKDIKQIRNLMTTYVNEAVFITLYGDDSINFTAMKPLQLEALAKRATKGANTRLEREAIKRVTFEGVNYLTQEEARNQNGSAKDH